MNRFENIIYFFLDENSSVLGKLAWTSSQRHRYRENIQGLKYRIITFTLNMLWIDCDES